MTRLLIALVVGLALGWLLKVARDKGAVIRAEREEQGRKWWTVVAVWPASKERFLMHVQADTARDAEDLVEWKALHEYGGQTIWVCAVFAGAIDNADKYATFEDPDVKPADWLSPPKETP